MSATDAAKVKGDAPAVQVWNPCNLFDRFCLGNGDRSMNLKCLLCVFAQGKSPTEVLTVAEVLKPSSQMDSFIGELFVPPDCRQLVFP